MVLIDRKHLVNIIHRGSCRSKRMTISMITSNLFDRVLIFDVCSAILLRMTDNFNCIIPLRIYTNSRSFFDGPTNIRHTSGKCLLIYLSVLHISCKSREINHVMWVLTEQDSTDSFTKVTWCPIPTHLCLQTRLTWRQLHGLKEENLHGLSVSSRTKR